nr:DUF3106 domain-containing protein [Stenotrophomonas sp. YIM B06876]
MSRGLVLVLLSSAAVAQATPATEVPMVRPAPLAESAGQTPLSWASMHPLQRRELRARYAAWQGLSEAERQRLRRAAGMLANLPPAQQTALRARFAALDQLHRDGWRLGPVLGALYPKLQPLFGYLPAAQRAPALALLRQLDDGQLAQLVLISQRTPPQERDAVRAQLLALAPAARAAWLSEKVGH